MALKIFSWICFANPASKERAGLTALDSSRTLMTMNSLGWAAKKRANASITD